MFRCTRPGEIRDPIEIPVAKTHVRESIPFAKEFPRLPRPIWPLVKMAFVRSRFIKTVIKWELLTYLACGSMRGLRLNLHPKFSRNLDRGCLWNGIRIGTGPHPFQSQ